MGTEQGAVQLQERIGRFDPDGSLTEGCRELVAIFTEHGERIARAFIGHFGQAHQGAARFTEAELEALVPMIRAYVLTKHRNLRDQTWADTGVDDWFSRR